MLHHTGISAAGSLRLMLRLDAGAEVLGLGHGRLPYVYVGFKEAAQSQHRWVILGGLEHSQADQRTKKSDIILEQAILCMWIR